MPRGSRNDWKRSIPTPILPFPKPSRHRANRPTPDRTAEDPLRGIRQSVVTSGNLPDPLPFPRGQPFYDGTLVDFDSKGTGFIYSYTPIEFAE